MSQNTHTRPQISLRFMLLMMVIFCVISGSLFYASRVPAIADELTMMFGGRAASGDSERRMHATFVMFTYTSPLLLAGTLATIVEILKYFDRAKSRKKRRRVRLEEQPSEPN